ncbi:hypothetical protein [Mixta calida]|uniref:hypothetical protein n=1 Tax=Mixta calida TaxID=665913 RepID=UPI00290A3668|nr:hypothetical protein [Mixta calida]MDU4291089.1 hypothetical protein [Mixta calida]
MAGNTFDFELRADDQVSGALKEISDQVKNLQPELSKTEEGLKLGGQETQDGLTDINTAFRTLGRYTKDNVQFIGDMVPPLRNFMGNAGKIGGIAAKFGLAGGAAYGAVKGITALGGGMADAAHDAYSLQIAAENAGMSVKDFSQLSGAMRLLGSDSESAKGSVEGLYKTFNDALQGRNSAALAIMNQVNTPIVKNADGTANVLKTVEKLAEVMPRLSPQNQKTVADALGLDANGLQLLREGAKLKALLAKADAVGLTVDPKINGDLVGLNRNINEVSASWDGLKQRFKQKLAGALLSDGSVNDGIKGMSDLMENGVNPISLGHAFGLNRGNDADMMRRAKNDPEFQKTLTPEEMVHLMTGQMTDSDRQKYRLRYGLSDQASQLAGDMKAITSQPNSAVNTPPVSGSIDPSAASVRNNNPWNINYAGQAGAVPAGRFARFPTPEAGVQAADRQLQLYATGKSANVNRPLKTLTEIITTASPRSDGNNTTAMIKGASKQLGVAPDDPLNLTDSGMRSRVLAALFNQEGNNPFSADQIKKILDANGSPLSASQAPADPPQMTQNDLPSVSSVTPPAQQVFNGVQSTEKKPPADSALVAKNPPAPADTMPVAPGVPSLVSPPAAPVRQGASAEELGRAVSDALKEQGLKLEVTFVNPQTGARQTVTATGGKVTTAMPFPG